jgi:hypothetical protein
MSAYLLILLAVFSRVIPHTWFSFTAVGGSLLYFGARRPLRQAVLPLVALAGVDYYLTTFVYSYPFAVKDYLLTWAWYVAVIVLGQILLKEKQNVGRIGAAVVLSSTSFFAASNFAVWSSGGGMYPHTLSGLMTCYAAGLPFYRNDLLATTLVTGLAFGVPALLRQMQAHGEAKGSGMTA